MKRYIITTAIAALTAASLLTSCDDMMDPQSGSYLYDSNLSLKNPEDSLYSTAGLLAKIQQLGENYVVLGELRGDLMFADPTADLELQELAEFKPQSRSTLTRRTDFYAVINHCNWMISKFDESIKNGEKDALANEYAAAVLYRAWTYLQLGLTYGSVNWITEPILSLEGATTEYPSLSLDQLVPTLIAEVDPFVESRRPDFGTLDNQISREFFLLPSALLADLCLYDGQYERAATLYHKAIIDTEAVINPALTQFTNSQCIAINGNFPTTYGDEALVVIPYSSNAKDYHNNLINMTINERPSLHPAEWWLEDMSGRSYYFGSANYISNTFVKTEGAGDLRGVVRFADGTYGTGGSVEPWRPEGSNENANMIGKFYRNASVFQGATTENLTLGVPCGLTRLPLVRSPHLYLRYAESVNRLGKPTLAYAVVRYGLNNETLSDSTKVDPSELAGEEPWLVWNESFLDQNVGTAVRGRGYGIAYPEATDEDLPSDMTGDELTLYVEQILADEMAAETAFEGNRFFDLARIARHRGGTEWFAEQVSRKFADPAEARSRLSDRANWFVR
ncbi:MAG: RagB/SusD family nutrient uptake outer membrane protein [Clostridium sp.]|nr:RagB/SusD family nutrient uptake outer membrane protein [Clostridium sp.]